MQEILTQAGVLVPVVIALAKVAKTLSFPTKFIPILDMAIGMLGSYLFIETELKFQMLIGVVAGLIACGTYSTVKNTVQAIKQVS